MGAEKASRLAKMPNAYFFLIKLRSFADFNSLASKPQFLDQTPLLGSIQNTLTICHAIQKINYIYIYIGR